MPTSTLYEEFLCRGGTAAALASVNPIPLVRQLVFETDTGNSKLGDGVTAYNSLAYVTTVDDAIVDGVTTRAPSQNAVFDALALKALVTCTGTAAGTNTLTSTLAPVPALADFLTISLRAAGANTTAVTFDANGTGAIAVTKLGGTALAAGDIAAAGHELVLRYRSSVPRWELLNPAASAASGQAAIQFKDEGVNVGSSGAITSLDVVGSGGTLAVVGTAATLTLSGGGNYAKVYEYIHSGGAATTITLSGLTLTAGYSYAFDFYLINATASDNLLSLFYNSDTTEANYVRTYNRTINGANSQGSSAAAYIDYCIASSRYVGQHRFKHASGDYPRLITSSNSGASSTTLSRVAGSHIRVNTAAVTSMTISGSIANAIANDSYIRIYEITA